jgi:hypothetical protein
MDFESSASANSATPGNLKGTSGSSNLSLPGVEQKSHNRRGVKDWEIVADNLSKAGWSLGWVSALDCQGRTIWIVDAHRDDGKRLLCAPRRS